MKEELEAFKIQNDELRAEINDLKTKLEILEKEKPKNNALDANLIESTKKIFTPGQIRKMQNPHSKLIRWSVNDITHAISLHAAGARAYRWLQKNNHPLPGGSTLRRWANKIDVSPGVLKFVFKLLKTHTSMSKLDKVCILMADEIKIKAAYEYDRNNDTLLKPSNYAQVVMARGLFSDWKQPIFYGYDQNITKPILCALIRHLHTIGIDVFGLTNDLGGANRGLWKKLEITEISPFFLHHITSNKIYTFADVPHLVKLIKNHLLDEYFEVDGKKITKAPLMELLESTNGRDLNIAHKLTTLHLDVKRAGRQKVKLAAQLLSHTNAKAIQRMAMLGKMKSENWQECADLIKTVNDWFDVFNSRSPSKDSRERVHGYGSSIIIQNGILNKMQNLFANLTVGEKKKKMQFQTGIAISTNALPLLYEDMKRRYNIHYLLTSRLNQDPLESFFGILRAIGGLHDHPTALEFKFRLRNYLLGRNDTILAQAVNVLPEQSQSLLKDAEIDFEKLQNVEDFNHEAETGTVTIFIIKGANTGREKQRNTTC